MEQIGQRQTRRTAEAYGLKPGPHCPGLNLTDYEDLRFHMPASAYYFPANGRRLVQHAKGYVRTFVNGTRIVSDDELTDELPGVFLRGR